MTVYLDAFDSPCGPVTVHANEQAVTAIVFAYPKAPVAPTALTKTAIAQLSEYFSGHRRDFTLPLAPHGTPFQQRVWSALCEIPYGETRSYADLANAIGNPKAVRAVGLANSKNPVSICIPCHRVIGKNGALTGYAGGLDRKAFLLNLECAQGNLL